MEKQMNSDYIKSLIINNDFSQISLLLDSGLDPNYENGLPLRLATRFGSRFIAKFLLEKGANPHVRGDSGATPLQMAVYSLSDWKIDDWTFLMDCFDSSQLADAAAVAIVQNNIPALEKILGTQRCDLKVSTTVTGKTVEELLRSYKLSQMFGLESDRLTLPEHHHRSAGRHQSPYQHKRNLSPSVAHFFAQAAVRPGLSISPSSHLIQPRGSPLCPGSPAWSLSPVSPAVHVQK